MEESEIEYIQRKYRTIWFAAFCRNDFSQKAVQNFRKIDCIEICAELERDFEAENSKITIKTLGHLLYGLVSIHGKQILELYEIAHSLLIAQKSYNDIIQAGLLQEKRLKTAT